MNYISVSFGIFICIGLLVYFIFPKKMQLYIILLMNIIFYTYSDIRHLVYLIITIISTWGVALICKKSKSKRIRYYFTLVACILNVGILLFVKFYLYLANIWNNHINVFQMPMLYILFPLGISFYTLQAVSYCIDVYKERIEAEESFVKYAVFISYFPSIVQGPIVRYKDIAPQLYRKHYFDYTRVKFGVQLALYGIFKKLVIADRAALCVNDVFGNYCQYGKIWILVGVVLYSVQIYADFSGCVDVCRGVSQMFGIEMINNFNAPYFAVSIKDFWRRWHISLSSWLRDYVYIPIGGNRRGRLRKYCNLLITFLISGIWHGVGIHYLVWGALHGVYQIIGEVIQPFKTKIIMRLNINTQVFSYRLLQRLITFCLVSIAWIFFRANGLREALLLIKSFLVNGWLMDFSTQTAVSIKDLIVLIVGIFIMICVSVLQQRYCIREILNRQNMWFRWGIYLIGIYSILIFGMYGSGYSSETFIYMQF